MKILISTFSYLPERSGIPVVVQYLAEGLLKKGHNVDIATKWRMGLEKEELINGIKVHRFNIFPNFYGKIVGDTKAFIDFVISFPKDVLILECVQCMSTDILLPYLKDIKSKIVIHSHGVPGLFYKPFEKDKDFIHTLGHPYRWYKWRNYYHNILPGALKEVDAVLCSSLCASDIPYFSKYVENTLVLENSANDIFFDEKNYEYPVSDILQINSSRYIVNIATLCDRKNQLLLIDVFGQSKIKDCTLVIIGTEKNKYYYKLLKRADYWKQQCGCEIKIFDKSIQRYLFPAILKKASLFVLSSRWEEYPITLVETMAVGTPFISTMAGNAHTLPGGLVARNAEEFSTLLKVILENPDYLKILGEQGKNYANNINRQDVIIPKFDKIINSL